MAFGINPLSKFCQFNQIVNGFIWLLFKVYMKFTNNFKYDGGHINLSGMIA